MEISTLFYIYFIYKGKLYPSLYVLCGVALGKKFLTKYRVIPPCLVRLTDVIYFESLIKHFFSYRKSFIMSNIIMLNILVTF